MDPEFTAFNIACDFQMRTRAPENGGQTVMHHFFDPDKK